MTLLKLTEIIQDVQAYLREFTSVVCLWKTGFYLMMGLKKKKKKALFVPVKQYPDVILYAVGGSALDGGRRLTLFARFLCFFPPSWCL